MLTFLDMDGVLADFVGGACKTHARPSPYYDPKNFGIFDIEKLWGITPDEFWKPIDNYDFWVGLEKTAEADWIVETVFKRFGSQNVAILTSPSQSPECFTGKKAWVEKHFPELKKRVIFSPAPAKKFLAGDNRLLIDDRDQNISQFRENGGKAIKVPRPWNSMYRWSQDAQQTLRTAFIQLGGN